MSTSRNDPVPPAERPVERPSVSGPEPAGSHELDIERDSDVPISTQIYWQLAYQIESGQLQPGARLPPVRELGAALRVNPNTIRAVYRRLADAGYVNGDAFDRLEVLESTAEAVILSTSLGEVRPMGDEVIEELVQAFLS